MTAFDRDQLLAALNEIGAAAVTAGTRFDIAVFGGSALMLASNFRFSTEDVDIAEIARPWPGWLSDVVDRIAKRNGWSEHWLNDAVSTFLSRLARAEKDLVFLGTFPRATEHAGLRVFVPTARYMLAQAQGAACLQVRQGNDGLGGCRELAGRSRHHRC